MYWNLFRKSHGFVPFGSNPLSSEMYQPGMVGLAPKWVSDPLWSQIYHPCYQLPDVFSCGMMCKLLIWQKSWFLCVSITKTCRVHLMVQVCLTCCMKETVLMSCRWSHKDDRFRCDLFPVIYLSVCLSVCVFVCSTDISSDISVCMSHCLYVLPIFSPV